MDGVIANTEHLHVLAEQQTCLAYDFDINPDDWNGFKGRTAMDIFSHLIKEFGDPTIHDPQELIAHKTDTFIALAEKDLEEIEGAVAFVRWSRQAFDKVALVTSSNRRVQSFIIDKLQIADAFDVIITGDDIEHGKPHPEPYQKSIKALGVSAISLVVEDSVSGIRSAHAAGCEVLAITSSHSSSELAKQRPRYIVEDYWQARSLLV